MRIILGAGAKVNQTCDVYNLWMQISQFYESPRVEGETKRDIPVTDKILPPVNPLAPDAPLEVPIVHAMVGDCRDKRRIIEAFKDDAFLNDVEYTWGNLYHVTSVFTNPAKIGIDVIVRPLSIICSNVVLGDHVDIGNLSNIGHDCVIGDYSVVAGGAAISGNVYIGRGVLIGQGASIKPGVRIGDGALIGTGAVVVKDVAPNMVVAGNPAKSSPKYKKVSPWSQLS